MYVVYVSFHVACSKKRSIISKNKASDHGWHTSILSGEVDGALLLVAKHLIYSSKRILINEGIAQKFE